MSATELIRGELPGRPVGEITGRWRAWLQLPVLVSVVLLAIILYAAFAHGAVSRVDETRTELCVVGVGALTWHAPL